jgi:hypothetical protein
MSLRLRAFFLWAEHVLLVIRLKRQRHIGGPVVDQAHVPDFDRQRVEKIKRGSSAIPEPHQGRVRARLIGSGELSLPYSSGQVALALAHRHSVGVKARKLSKPYRHFPTCISCKKYAGDLVLALICCCSATRSFGAAKHGQCYSYCLFGCLFGRPRAFIDQRNQCFGLIAARAHCRGSLLDLGFGARRECHMCAGRGQRRS